MEIRKLAKKNGEQQPKGRCAPTLECDWGLGPIASVTGASLLLHSSPVALSASADTIKSMSFRYFS